MTDFSKTRWSDPEFAQGYRDRAEIYIVERQRLFEIMRSYFRYFMGGKRNIRVLDLGCGDAIVTHKLLTINESISATLLDGSEDMLNKSKERLAGFDNINYLQASFQEVLEKDIIQGAYDFVVSSMAIHHLTQKEKRTFFEMIYSCLIPNGYFMNIDVTVAPTEALEEWYMKLWREWMDEKKVSLGRDDVSSDDVIRSYKDAEENKPDTIDYQLNALKSIGFRDVDCFYKYGIFAIYGGRR